MDRHFEAVKEMKSQSLAFSFIAKFARLIPCVLRSALCVQRLAQKKAGTRPANFLLCNFCQSCKFC